jgi:methionine biosynthesis protein MetW
MYTYKDNRNYDYSNLETEDRVEYSYIINLVKPNSSVIDLGCGSGSLMQRLINEKNAKAYGIDISESAVDVCRKKGLNADKGEIDKQLDIKDNSFDYAICNVTIQMVMYPEVLLKEMKRIAKYQIISFPNFAYYKNRIDLLIKGRMPKYSLFNHKWYNTGHIHQFSVKDFYQLVKDVEGLKIIERKFILSVNPVKNFLIRTFPNLFDQLPIFLLKNK